MLDLVQPYVLHDADPAYISHVFKYTLRIWLQGWRLPLAGKLQRLPTKTTLIFGENDFIPQGSAALLKQALGGGGGCATHRLAQIV